MNTLDRGQAVRVFLVFALGFFISALVRAVTATLSPRLVDEFGLNAQQLGLLAGAYFAGFAALQLPLGTWLDVHDPKRVILVFLSVGVAGCAAFALAQGFWGLLAARTLAGIGLGACLMAPLVAYRRWLNPMAQLRANSWMLMTGSLGMLSSTLPVQWLLPRYGWRSLFWGLALLLGLTMVLIARFVPTWQGAGTNPGGGPAAPPGAPPAATTNHPPPRPRGDYAGIWRHPYFRRMVPVGLINYGGMLSIQTLWAIPWMIRVGGATPVQAATGLFGINLAMLLSFWSWGMAVPRLARRGIRAEQLIVWGMPLSLGALALFVFAGPLIPAAGPWFIAFFCVSSTCLSLAQPAVGMAFPGEQAGRALSAYNLVIFCGVFITQWGLGWLVDGFQAWGWSASGAFQGALGVLLMLNVFSYAYLLAARRA